VHSASLSTLGRLRGLLEVSRRARDERDLTRLVDQIAETISDSLGFRTVAINLYRPAEGDFVVTTVHGSDEARAALLGTASGLETWQPHFSDRFLRSGAYLIPQGEGDWDGVVSHVPDLPLGIEPDGWHPEDALLVPMRGADGELIGVVAVDEPETGLRPGDDELEILVAFSEHVAAAIEAARDSVAAARDRAALARLLDVSASLVELDSVDAVLAAVAHGIGEALEFEKVAVCTLDADGRFVPKGTAGWNPGDPGLDFWITQADLDVLLVPEFELEGCYLIENDVANSRVGNRSNYASQRGGGGPRAWQRHWLLVPLVERDGSRRGFVWVDDPVDSMLPSRERLQALRTFANQATMALRAAQDYETTLELYAAVRRSEELHRHVVDGSTDLIALLDAENRVVLASRAYADVLGYEPGELLGSLLSDLIHPDDLAEARRRVVADVIAEPVTARMRRRDGRWVLVEGVTTPIRDESDAIALRLVIARDITERERLQEQLRQAQKMEAVGRLAGGIAHDFNNLLTAIGGYAELGLSDLESGDANAVRESIVQIGRASSRAADLTAQLLAFSRKQVLHLRELDLNEIVSDMTSMLARMLGEDVVLAADLDPRLGRVLADPGQIEQVVLNLAINARDAMPDGGDLSIRTTNLELASGDAIPAPELLPGGYVLLRVADTGIGMEPGLAERIFEPFFTTKEVGAGTGLGLATVHGIVSQSGGAIWVESTPGEGTSFSICFPRV